MTVFISFFSVEGAWDPCIDGLQQFHGVLQEKAMLESWGDQSCTPLSLYTDDNHMIDIFPPRKRGISGVESQFSLYTFFKSVPATFDSWVLRNMFETLSAGQFGSSWPSRRITAWRNHRRLWSGSGFHVIERCAKSRTPRKSFLFLENSYWYDLVRNCVWESLRWMPSRPSLLDVDSVLLTVLIKFDYLVSDRFEPPRWCAPLCPGGREGSSKRETKSHWLCWGC